MDCSARTILRDHKKPRLLTRELPEEIVNEEILARLPVETLLPLRCVCKSWESLFFTPEFIQAHLKSTHDKNSIYQDCLVARSYKGFMILSRYKQTRIVPPRPELIAPLSNTRLVGSINGLVCLVNQIEFFLWNPIIGRYREFSFPQETEEYTTPCTLVKKCPYWHTYCSGKNMIVKFEVGTQKFRSLPVINDDIVGRNTFNFVNVKD
ncbi:putative F-box protein At1g33530 [Apium graveolens]|uniref:putative F-box protein At1g33530 n=1 Tax=Apium graveolens TaxID=4045 RepID=UPI003D79220E